MNKKPSWFKGVFPALVTPFVDGEMIDEAAYRSLIRFILPHVNGLVPVGTTGEFVYLTTEEKQQAIDIALDEAAGRVPVIAGTGCASTRETVALTRYADYPLQHPTVCRHTLQVVDSRGNGLPGQCGRHQGFQRRHALLDGHVRKGQGAHWYLLRAR